MRFLDETKATSKDPGFDGFRVRMISNYRKNKLHLIWEEINQVEDVHQREMYETEFLRFRQANLARGLNWLTGARRLLERQRRRTIKSRVLAGAMKLLCKGRSKRTPTPTSKKLQLESDQRKIAKVSNIELFSKVEGRYGHLGTGTLEAHVNGFLCTNNGKQVAILYEKINAAFCLVKDEGRQPFVHFSLHDQIMVEDQATEDVQFRWSEKTAGLASLHFANRAQSIWAFQPMSNGPFESLEKKDKFSGKLPLIDQQFFFYVTLFSLVQLDEEPSIMVKLQEIEIVNLAKTNTGEISMTVVSKDLRSDKIRINSIPLSSLAVIKRQLDEANVKFYECQTNVCDDVVASIVADPVLFINNGAWNCRDLPLEDGHTLIYYSDASHTESSGEEDSATALREKIKKLMEERARKQ